MTERQLDVVYCEGWAPEDRVLVGRISAAAARERHERGEQYAVALTDGAERPVVLLELALAHRFAQGWHFDEHGRRTWRFDYRVLPDGQLFRVGEEEWEYTSPEQPDLDKKAHRVERHWQPGGWGMQLARISRGLRQTRLSTPMEELTQPVPAFGDWLPPARLDEPVRLRDTADPDTTEPATAPWRPPAPIQPFALAEMFTPGTRFVLPEEGRGRTVVIETQPAGTLRLTSGRLVAADPNLLADGMEPFAATVAPGAYPVELATIRFSNDRVRVVAAKVTIAEEPVASWHLALRPGEDTALLQDGEFHGFGVDTGLACLVDADALKAKLDDELFEEVNGFLEVAEPESGANVIAFESGYGDGAYPTWEGHAEDGAVVSFVVDMLVLHGGQILP